MVDLYLHYLFICYNNLAFYFFTYTNMRKILLSVALVTTLIAPAIFAAVQSTRVAPVSENRWYTGVTTWSWYTGAVTWTGQNRPELCMKSVTQSYKTEKQLLTKNYTDNMRTAMAASYSGSTISWEKQLRNSTLRSIQTTYVREMKTLQEKYTTQQKSCRK